jgi:hypothetical protein
MTISHLRRKKTHAWYGIYKQLGFGCLQVIIQVSQLQVMRNSYLRNVINQPLTVGQNTGPENHHTHASVYLIFLLLSPSCHTFTVLLCKIRLTLWPKNRNPSTILDYIQCNTEKEYLYSICYSIYKYVLLYDTEMCLLCTLTVPCVAYHMDYKSTILTLILKWIII